MPAIMSDDEMFSGVAEAGVSDDEMFSDVEPERLPYTGLEAGGMGFIQGGTLDFADEIEGGARALYDVATGPEELKDILKTYQKRRDAARERYKQAQADSPAAYTTGNIAGGVGSSFLPGGALLNAAKGAKLAATVGKGALSGAVAGAGASEADLVEGDIENFAEDVESGAMTGGLTSGAIKGAGALGRAIKPREVVKKGANVMLNTPEELTELMMDRGKEAIMEAPKRYELVGKYQGILDKLKDKTIEGSRAARDELEGVTIKGSEVSSRARKIADALKARSEGVQDDPQRAAATGWLGSIEKGFKPKAGKASGLLDAKGLPIKAPVIDKELSGSRIKDTLQAIDRNTEWDIGAGKFGKIEQGPKKQLRKELDSLLKSKSPNYAESMKMVAQDAGLLDKASKMGSEKTLANVFRRIETDEWGAGQFPREILEQVDARMGTDILDQVKLSYAREAFDKSVTQGSMNVNKFRNLIEGIPMIGRMAGFLGAAVDKYGRKATMGAIDGAMYLEKVWEKSGAKGFKESLQPFIDQAKKGNYSAAAALQMAEQNHPEGFR